MLDLFINPVAAINKKACRLGYKRVRREKESACLYST